MLALGVFFWFNACFFCGLPWEFAVTDGDGIVRRCRSTYVRTSTEIVRENPSPLRLTHVIDILVYKMWYFKP